MLRFTSSLLITLTLASPVLANDALNVDMAPIKPSVDVIKKGQLALVWCTNSVGRISRGQMDKNQITGAVEKYFKKRDGLEKESTLMGYQPEGEREMPYASFEEDAAIFKGMTYQEMIRYCDTAMMSAYNKLINRPKPTNLAERKIAEFGNIKKQDQLLEEQSIGKKLGFEGITYGIVDAMEDLRRGRYDVAELKKFLIKPDMYDKNWEVIGSDGPQAAYGTWSGNRPLIFVVNKTRGRDYVSGNLLSDAYYQVEGVESFKIVYENGAAVEELLVLKEVSI